MSSGLEPSVAAGQATGEAQQTTAAACSSFEQQSGAVGQRTEFSAE